jgi:hypothetical protein
MDRLRGCETAVMDALIETFSTHPILSGVAATLIAAAIIGLVKWLFSKPPPSNTTINNHYFQGKVEDMTDEKKLGDTYNVSSTNQSGGITAGRINVYNQQPGWRDINAMPNLEKMLLHNLSQFRARNFKVTAVWGDEEAHNFAHQLRDWLRANGFTVEDFVSQSAFTAPQPAISYQFEGANDETVLLKAGNQNSTVRPG